MKSNKNIWLMFAIALLQGMVFYGPITTLYRQSVGVTIFQITVIESISLALCLVLELPWGIIADRIGYKYTMIFCCCLYFLSKIVFWRATGFESFLAERIMLSIVLSGLSGVDYSILYLSSEKDTMQKVFGVYNNLQSVGLLFASAIYALLIKDNYRLSGLLTVFSFGIAMMISLGLDEVKNKEREASEQKQTASFEFIELLKKTLKNRYYILFLLGVALLNETHQTITVFLNQLQYVKGGLTNRSIGYIYILVTILGLLGVFSEKLTRKLGVTSFGLIIYGFAILSCLMLGITFNPWLSVIAIIILRLCFSLFQPLQMNIQNKQIISQNRATELSINSVIINCVSIGTNLIYGKLAEINIKFSMFAGSVACFMGLILFYLYQRKRE